MSRGLSGGACWWGLPLPEARAAATMGHGYGNMAATPALQRAHHRPRVCPGQSQRPYVRVGASCILGGGSSSSRWVVISAYYTLQCHMQHTQTRKRLPQPHHTCAVRASYYCTERARCTVIASGEKSVPPRINHTLCLVS